MKRNSLQYKLSRAYRRSTGLIRRLPDFVVIGVVKGGSSSIYDYVVQHPMVTAAIKKEVHYFNNNTYPKQDPVWYQSHFPLSRSLTRSQKLTGEASPEYFHGRETPQRIKDLIPDVKLILVLRNPIERAYSHYSMNMRNRKKKQALEPQNSFSEIVLPDMERLKKTRPVSEIVTADKLEPHGFSYLSSGLYIYSLRRWLQMFPANQLLVLKSEDLFSHPEATTNTAFEFLGLEPYSGAYNVVNAGSYAKLAPELRQALADFFEPYNQAVYELLGQDFGWN